MNNEQPKDELTDLFEHPELMPKELKTILISRDSEEIEYNDLEALLDQVKEVGYIFEYGLDAIPYGLRKIEE
jgi:hypothetical protein